LEKLVNSLKGVPVLGALIKFGDARPRLAMWIVLSLGIVILLMVEARDVGLLIGQWIALIIASVLVAGMCIWIVSWEDSDEAAADGKDKAPAVAATEEPQPPSEK
jgi:K+ transporter